MRQAGVEFLRRGNVNAFVPHGVFRGPGHGKQLAPATNLRSKLAQPAQLRFDLLRPCWPTNSRKGCCGWGFCTRRPCPIAPIRTANRNVFGGIWRDG